MTTQVPSKIGKYDVTGVIGRGGMGVVYQAQDPHLDRRVAIKMITGAFSENSDMLKRFFREAQSLGSLQHPNIVTVFDLGDCGGNPYFVMEYLEGEGLDSILANGRQLNLLEKISIIVQVCNGLGYAHRRGVIHRDIKPANIMIMKDGAVKIFDFGIAHAGQANVTRTGEVLGTLRYMAPEQVNSKGVDSRTDIFSTGVVLYQLITDHLPFDGDNTASTLMKIVSEPPPPLGNFLSVYPPEMEQILLKALAKNPGDRYATAEEFAMDLAELQGQLKEELIGREMQEVSLLIDQGDVYKAQGSLLRVLKIDQQHTRANRLLREVQQRIQRDELGKQVRGLRERAEGALADEQFDRALEHVDRALALDRDNFDLIQLREGIREAAERAEKLRQALKIAEAAQAEGKLEAAREAVESALALAPNDTQARTLQRSIARELEERARHEQMEGYLQEARQELSSRRFTAALMILKQAEELDPAAPQVHSLMETAAAGQEQERRRRELEALTQEVEDALNRDDYRTACQKADEALTRFPDDRNLLKLKGLADRQRQIEERKQLVDGLMAESRVLLQEGRHEELEQKLERAIAQLGPEARLQSLLGVVTERLQRERTEQQREERLQQARKSLENHAFDEAIHTLETQAREAGDDAEVQELLARVRSEQTAAVQAALTRAEQEAVLDLRVSLLEEALRMNPRDSRVREQLHQARNLNQVIIKIVAEAKKLEDDRQYDQALAKWETVSAVYQHYPELKNILKRVRDLRDRALTSARQNWIDRVETALRACDYDQAMALLGPATQAFPWDNDLMGLQEQAESGARQRVKALKMLGEGRKAFANQQWDAGAQLMVRAHQAASQDVMIRDQSVDELAQASRAALEKNWQASELILRRLAEIDPAAASSQDLEATIQQRKRESAVTGAMNAATGCLSSGDLDGARRAIEHGLASYPDETRLLESKVRIEGEIRRRQEEQRAAREEELRRKQAREQEARDREARERELRAKQEEEERQRAQAREQEQKQREAASLIQPERPDLSATQIFVQRMSQPAEVTAPQPAPPVAPPAKLDPPPSSPAVTTDTLHSQRTLGLSDGFTTRVRQALRDTTLFGKAPAENPSADADAGSDELQDAHLPQIERHLAGFIGPLAKVLVKRAAGKTQRVTELYTMLAASLEREADRKAFLAKRAELGAGKPNAPFTKLATPAVVAPPPSPEASLPGEITAAAIELGGRRLAAHMGPIAPVLARKEAKRAANLREFWQLLAEHVASPVDRERFLREAGIAGESGAPDPRARRNETMSFSTRPANPDSTTRQFKPGSKSE